MAAKPPSARPSKQQVLDFIDKSDSPVGRREIARAFQIKGPDRTWLRSLLRELEDEGRIEQGEKRKVMRTGDLPAVAVIEVDHIDLDGEVICRPHRWNNDGPPPKIFLAPQKRGGDPAEGDRILARLQKSADGSYEAKTIRVIGRGVQEIIGVFEKVQGGGMIRPVDRRERFEFFVPDKESAGAKTGEYVTAEALPAPAGKAGRRARIKERLGDHNDPRSISLLAIHAQGLPVDFPQDALDQASELKAVGLDKRVDLRKVPLVTIDGADARDFDDAVFAEPDEDPKNQDGWHLIVAIADVSWYVRTQDALDRSAYDRGTSAYFPDRVVPMLPERLSNDLCSLRPNEDRGVLAAHIWIDRNGGIVRKKFERGLIRSHARLTYEQVQAAREGRTDDTTAPLVDTIVAPLYGAYQVLLKARGKRGTLDLDIPERVVELQEDGAIARIGPRPRLDSHKLIEEFMIAANVAAAEYLHERDEPVMYRVHEPPSMDKLEELRQSLQVLGFNLPKGETIKPLLFARLLDQAGETDKGPLVSQLILRSQTKAVYAPTDLGHFGLALRRYCHFTSPIRRYADVLVHRALVRAAKLGAGGLPEDAGGKFEQLGEHISMLERRAEAAERDAVDRFTTVYVADQVGAEFAGRVNGVTRFGLFVTLDQTGADGLVPISTLPRDYYHHDEIRHCLAGESSGRIFSLGEPVTVELTEADATTGSLVFRITEGGHVDKKIAAQAAKGQRRPSGPGHKHSRGKGPGKGSSKGSGKPAGDNARARRRKIRNG